MSTFFQNGKISHIKVKQQNIIQITECDLHFINKLHNTYPPVPSDAYNMRSE